MNRFFYAPRTVAGWVLLLALVVASQSMSAASPLVIGSADSYTLGGASVDILADPGRSLTIDDAVSPRIAERFIPSRHAIPNFGMTDAAYWFRFTIDGGPRANVPWLLLLDQPLMNLVDLYIPREGGRFDRKRSGDLIPMDQREIREREIVLPLPLDGAPRTFYLRTWIAGRAQMPLTVMTREALRERNARLNLLFGGYIGIELLLLVIGLFMYVMLRDRTYLYYVLVVLGLLLAHLGMKGYLYTYLLPGHPAAHELLVVELCVGAVLVGVLFARRFLRLTEYAPGLNRLLTLLIWGNLAVMLAGPLMPMLLFKRLSNINFTIATLMALVAAIVSYRRGFVPARFYAYGRVTLTFCGLVFPLANEGYLPINWFTKNSLLVASLGDVLFITLAMGHQIFVMRNRVVTLVADLEREVTERTGAHLALKEQMEERQRLEREVERVGYEERRRISHELHDGLCQQLTGARLRFAALEDRLASAGLAEEAQPLGMVMKESVDHAYALSRRLWNSEESGEPVIDLEVLARSLGEKSGIPITCRLARACGDCTFASLAHVHLIAREALANAVKHAGATRIDLALDCADGLLRLAVSDNGSGIGVASGRVGGLGVGMMEYRAAAIGGRLEITTGTGGTTVVCTVPCSGASDHTL